MKFYEFNQTNSGGIFIENKTLCGTIIIEAKDKDMANYKAKKLGCYWDGVKKGIDCSCCGDRWDPIENDGEHIDIDKYSKEGYDGMILNTIEEYAQYIANRWGVFTKPSCRIYYNNGNVKEIYCKFNREII